RLATSPIMIAMPTERPGEPFVLDMATSVVAEGKLRVATNKGVPVPEQWIVDGDGNPTTDPRDFYGTGGNSTPGALLTVGGATSGYKGFGLSMAVEALSGVLSGAGTAEAGPRGTNGVFLMALDPDAFAGLDAFMAMLTGFADYVRQPPYQPGVEEVLVAGEPERRAMAHRLEHGLELDDETWKQIVDAGVSYGVSAIDLTPSV
ncbi:MAG: Ldh family oxidoreductase, partial [Dehalococcoidia bacterium]